MSISVIIAELVTGVLRGVFASGGSIVTMPALLYLLDVEPKSALAMSLGIVAITATITALQHWKRGNVNLKVTAMFGLFSVAGTYAGALLGVITPVVIQLGLFAVVMYAVACEKGLWCFSAVRGHIHIDQERIVRLMKQQRHSLKS